MKNKFYSIVSFMLQGVKFRKAMPQSQAGSLTIDGHPVSPSCFPAPRGAYEVTNSN
jgi:hypothetical protein